MRASSVLESRPAVSPGVLSSQISSETASEFADVSPFGVQGLRREQLQILKPECITRLAVTLALTATRKQIEDDDYVAGLLAQQPGWQDEFTVVHLIEKSLWIQGRSDLVMTLTPDPSQIPDDPPASITRALTRSYALHPHGTVWFGVPLFGDETTDNGLPIPLTADQIRAEQARRLVAAREHALRHGWMYRALLRGLRVAGFCGRVTYNILTAPVRAARGLVASVRQARRDSKRRASALLVAEIQYFRFGRSWNDIPEHSTRLGRFLQSGLRATKFAGKYVIAPTAAMSGVTASAAVIHLAPSLFFVPLTIVACDPFLFVELPEEPNKLRHLGHWFWQGNPMEKRKLHLHA